MQHEKRFILSSRQPVRWGDQDPQGHVNNTLYFRYMEQARIEWLEDLRPLSPAGQGPIVASATCDYLKPIVYPAVLDVKLYVGTPGRSSVRTYYEIADALPGAIVYATGSSVMVWYDRATGKSVPLPEPIRARILG